MLFLIFINDLSIAIKHSETFHFADDTCLLNIEDSVKHINKVVNKDLKFPGQWLNPNKITAEMRIISFTSFNDHTLPIFAKLNIIKFPDLISFCNGLFLYKHFPNNSSSVFSSVFILTSNTHEQNTRSASYGLLTKPCCSTCKYGTNAFAASAIKLWDFFRKKVSYPTINSNCWLRTTFSNLLIRNVVKNKLLLYFRLILT